MIGSIKHAVAVVAALVVPALLVAANPVSAAPFGSGNVIVYRVGGTANPATPGAAGLLTAGNPVFLDEYTPAGVFVQSIAMPTVAAGSNKALVASNGSTNAATEGLLTRSANGFCLAVPGYATAANQNTRVVGRVIATGSVDTTTGVADSGVNSVYRGAATADCNGFWMTSGSDGLRYVATLGAATSASIAVSPAATRVADIFDGQLYVTSNTATFIGINQVGTSMPTSSATVAKLPGFTETTATNAYGYFFAKLNPSSTGNDTLYLADGTKGIMKFALVSGAWTQVGTAIGAGESHRGFAGTVAGTTVTLFAVKGGSTTAATGGGTFVKVVDTGGYNAPFSSTTQTTLATFATNTTFRGVALAPESPQIVSSMTGGNGSINPTGTQTATFGVASTFTVQPDAGYQAVVGGSCGGSLTGTTYTTNPITANCTVTASFVQLPSYQVTPSKTGNGSIQPDVPVSVVQGATTQFTIEAASGSYTSGVDSSCGGSLTGTLFTTGTVTTDCTVVANFLPLPTFAVTQVVTGNGTLSPSGTQTITQGSTATFMPTPGPGNTVIMSGCAGKMNAGIFTTGPITADCTVTASFSTKNILFVGNSYTFARVDPAMTFNAANVNDLTAAFNAQYPNGTNSWPWNGATCTGVPFSDGCFEPHPWGGVPGIFKALTVQAGLDFNVSFSTRNAATLRGHFLNTSNAVWDLRSNIASQKWDIVMVQGQSDEPLPANKSKNGNPNSFKTYASQIARYVHAGNGQSTDLVTSEQAIYAAEGFGTSSSTTARTIPPNFNANPAAKVYVMQNWSRPDMVEPHKCTVADYTSMDGAPLVDPGCAGGTNGTNGDNNVYYTSQPTTALNLNDITTDMNAALSSLLTGSNQLAGVIPTGNAFQKAVDANAVKNSAFYNAGGTYDESGGQMNLWWLDRTHGSKYGSYLSALTHFARLVGQDPLQFGPGDPVAAGLGISGADAITLQQLAKAAVVPGAPTAPSITAGSGSVTVSFTAPGNLGGLDITGYTATCGGQSASAGASPIVVSGLTNGTGVTCTVVASNSVGNSVPSTASNSATPMGTSSTAITANLNPTVVGQTVVFTATVTATGSPATGNVTFYDAASVLCANAPVSGNQAQCVTDALPAGSRSITAAYSGDVQYLASTSAPHLQTVNASGTLQLSVAKAGSGTGVVQSAPPGITCGADCVETYAAATPVTLTATADAGFVFTGWLGACTGRGTCSVSLAASASVVATFAPASTPLHLDVDASGGYSGDSDGVIVARYLFGTRGAPLVDGTAAAQEDPRPLVQLLDNIQPLFDVDGDGRVDALTDGVLIVRYLLGVRGAALTAAALSPNATRTSSSAVEAYLQGITPALP